jgi:hypothetical protein
MSTATFDTDSDFGDELIALADIVKRFLSTYKLPIIGPVPEFYQFLTEVANLTITCLKNMKDELSGDGTWTGEAADIFLDTWASLCK